MKLTEKVQDKDVNEILSCRLWTSLSRVKSSPGHSRRINDSKTIGEYLSVDNGLRSRGMKETSEEGKGEYGMKE